LLPILPIALPTGWPAVGPSYAYLIRREPVTLIDCGLSTPEARAALLEGLAQAGLSLKDIRRLLITHAHSDHLGLAGWIQAESGAELWIHPLEAGKLFTPDWWITGRDRFLTEAGIPVDVAVRLGRRHAERIARVVTPAKDWRYFQEGEKVAFDGAELTVIHTPGHSLGHVCFWEEATGRLIGGDLLLEGSTPNPFMEILPPDWPEVSRLMPAPYAPYRPMAVAQFNDSLRRVGALPIGEVFPGHGPVIKDLPKLIGFYAGRQERKLERLRNRLAEEWTAFDLMHEVFPRLGENEYQLGLSDVVGHLDLLVTRGDVAVRQVGDSLRYQLV
jgi:glyoxylase-like metal-dependent hydrolase (beta-lactamase superfamily II)